jgi:hypothetical protein
MSQPPCKRGTCRAALVCLISGLCIAGTAQAQRLLPAAAAASSAAGIAYRSSLADYKRDRDPDLASWREANDAVGRIGGWRAYAREARPSEPARKQPAMPQTPSTSAPARAAQP